MPRPRARVARHRTARGTLVVFALGLLTVFVAPARAAPTWLSALSVSGSSTCSSLAARSVVSAPDGTTVAAWQRRDDGCGGVTRVEVAVRLPGGAFSAPSVLSNAAAESVDPALAVDASGTAIAVWVENGFISYSQRPPGGSFAPAQTIPASSVAGAPAVAIGGGTVVVTWIAGSNTKVAVKPAGSATFDPITTFATAGEPSFDPDVAMNEAGDAVVSWRTEGVTLDSVRAAARPAGGAFTAPLATVFSTPLDGDHIDLPKVALDPLGRATLLWAHYDSAVARHVIRSSARSTSGDFGPSEAVSDPSLDSGSAGLLDVAVDSENTAIGVWSAGTVQMSVRPSGGSFDDTIRDISPPGTFISDPVVRLDPGGRAIAVWLTTTGDDRIQSTVRPKHGSFGAVAEVQLVPAASGSMVGPTPVALDDEGNAVTIWRRTFDTDPDTAGLQAGYRVDLAAFDAAGPRLDALSVPASATAGRPVAVSTAAFDRWSPATTTWDFGDGGTAPGAAASHVYAGAGAYTVRATSTDAVGNATTGTRLVEVAAAPPPPPPPPPPTTTTVAKLSTAISFAMRAFETFSRFTALSARNTVPAGATIRIGCSGRGCPFTFKTIRQKSSARTVSLLKYFNPAVGTGTRRRTKVARLRVRAKVEIKVTAPGRTGRYLTLTIRASRQPRAVRGCLNAATGAKIGC